MLLLRIPEQVTDDGGTRAHAASMEGTGRNITSDRLASSVTSSHVYEETANRNPGTFTKGAAVALVPAIILSGVKDFNDAIKSARDRGDIPRRWAVEAWATTTTPPWPSASASWRAW
jgi:hypothetical protein